MNPVIIIPARLDSTRLPNKPLAIIGDKPMILHVLHRAEQSGVGPVVVACGDQEIADVTERAGGQAILTDPTLPSGSDRVISVISGAPITTPDATDPASMPMFSPSDDAILAEIGSNTEAGCMQ